MRVTLASGRVLELSPEELRELADMADRLCRVPAKYEFGWKDPRKAWPPIWSLPYAPSGRS